MDVDSTHERPEMVDPCPDGCHGFGFHFIPARDGTLVGHVIERCDLCQKFDGDESAAAASGCEYEHIGDEGREGYDPNYYVLTLIPDDSPVSRQRRLVLEDIYG